MTRNAFLNLLDVHFQVEKMNEIAKLKAKEEKRKLESEVRMGRNRCMLTLPVADLLHIKHRQTFGW